MVIDEAVASFCDIRIASYLLGSLRQTPPFSPEVLNLIRDISLPFLLYSHFVGYKPLWK